MWEQAYWRAGLGTPFNILHGTYDATPPGDPVLPYRPRYTDIAFARLAQRLLNIDHLMTQVYEEHPWGHTSGHTLEVGGALPELQRFFGWMTQQTRNPYQARVVAATPADGVVSSPHNRWVSINATRSGNILFDVTSQGSTGDPIHGSTGNCCIKNRQCLGRLLTPLTKATIPFAYPQEM